MAAQRPRGGKLAASCNRRIGLSARADQVAAGAIHLSQPHESLGVVAREANGFFHVLHGLLPDAALPERFGVAIAGPLVAGTFEDRRCEQRLGPVPVTPLLRVDALQ